MSIPPIGSGAPAGYEPAQSPQEQAAKLNKTITDDLDQWLTDSKQGTITPGEEKYLLHSLQEAVAKLGQLEKRYPGAFTFEQKQTTNSLSDLVTAMGTQPDSVTPGELTYALEQAKSLHFK